MEPRQLIPWVAFARPLPETEPERAAARALRILGWFVTGLVLAVFGVVIAGGVILALAMGDLFGVVPSALALVVRSLPVVAAGLAAAFVVTFPCALLYNHLCEGGIVPRAAAIAGGLVLALATLAGPALLVVSVFRLYSFAGILVGLLMTVAAPFFGRAAWGLLRADG